MLYTCGFAEDRLCNICFDKIDAKDELCVEPCKHTYHSTCWTNYVRYNRAHALPVTCPTCRGRVRDQDELSQLTLEDVMRIVASAVPMIPSPTFKTEEQSHACYYMWPVLLHVWKRNNRIELEIEHHYRDGAWGASPKIIAQTYTLQEFKDTIIPLMRRYVTIAQQMWGAMNLHEGEHILVNLWDFHDRVRKMDVECEFAGYAYGEFGIKAEVIGSGGTHFFLAPYDITQDDKKIHFAPEPWDSFAAM